MRIAKPLLTFLALFLLFVNSSQAQNPGDVVVVEVMPDPAFVTDANGEWFEVYNATNAPIDLGGWVLKDNGTNLYTVSGSLIIPAGGFLVFGNNANTATNGGLVVDRQVNNFSLANTTDAIILKTAGGVTIDSIVWDNGVTWPDPTGASMVFTGCASADNNLGANWTTATTRELSYSGAGTDFGSPGTMGTLQNLVFNFSATSTNSGCGLNNGGIDLTVAGCGAPFTYSWSNTATTQDLTNIGPGTYTVTVTGTGVSVMDTFIISAQGNMNLTFNMTPTSCQGVNNGALDLTVTGGTPTYTYAWSNGAITQDISGLSPGGYMVTVTDGQGCTNSAGVNVSQGTPFTLAANTTDASCAVATDGAIDLTVTGNGSFTYAWSNSASSEDLTGVVPGSYTVTVTDTTGCIATGTYTVTTGPPMGATATATDATCSNSCDGSADVTTSSANSPFTYSWSSGDTVQNPTGLCPGNYTVTVTDSLGCTAVGTTAVGSPPAISLSTSSTPATGTNNDGTATVNASGGTPPYTYFWTPGSGTTATINGLSPGTYIVEVTDGAGCVENDTVVVSVFNSTAPQANAFQLQIAPNPANTFLSVLTDGGNELQAVEILQTDGRMIYSIALSGQTDHVDVSQLPAGFYLFRIQTRMGMTTERVLVSR